MNKAFLCASPANTRSFAAAGAGSTAINSAAISNRGFISVPSEFVRAMGADIDLVHQLDGVVVAVGARVFVAQLQAQQTELAVEPGQHQRVTIDRKSTRLNSSH